MYQVVITTTFDKDPRLDLLPSISLLPPYSCDHKVPNKLLLNTSYLVSINASIFTLAFT